MPKVDEPVPKVGVRSSLERPARALAITTSCPIDVRE